MRTIQSYAARSDLPLKLVVWPLVPATLAILGWALQRHWLWAILGVVSLHLGVTSMMCGLGLWGIRYMQGHRDWKVPLLALGGLVLAGIYLFWGLTLTARV